MGSGTGGCKAGNVCSSLLKLTQIIEFEIISTQFQLILVYSASFHKITIIYDSVCNIRIPHVSGNLCDNSRRKSSKAFQIEQTLSIASRVRSP